MVTDPIGDLLIQIKNASLAGNLSIKVPFSRMKNDVALLLRREGYIEDVKKFGDEPKYFLKITIKYNGKDSAITDVRRMSKPGLRVYIRKDKIPTVVGGMGIAVLSTSQGIMTGREARKHGIGGEFLCKVW